MVSRMDEEVKNKFQLFGLKKTLIFLQQEGLELLDVFGVTQDPDPLLRQDGPVPAGTVGSRERNFLALDLTVPTGAEPFYVQ